MLKTSHLYSMLLVGCYLIGASVASAFAPEVNTPALPYEITNTGLTVGEEKIYLGALEGDPHMYEFAIGVKSPLALTIIQPETNQPTLPFSLIVVKVNDNNRGVGEVGRLVGTGEWSLYRDSLLGMELKKSDTFAVELNPGIYRVEVSMPDNSGKYMLVFGGDELNPPGYFSTLKAVFVTQRFFDRPFLAFFLSAYVYYLLGIMVIIGLLWLTWRWRERLRTFVQTRYG